MSTAVQDAWVELAFGVDLSGYESRANGRGKINDSEGRGTADGNEPGLPDPRGRGASGVADDPEDEGPLDGHDGQPSVPAEETGGSMLSHVGRLVSAAAAGFATHVVAGAVPYGAVGAVAGDAVVEARMAPEQKVMYGLGSLAAAVVDAGAAVGGISVGAAGAAPTLGASLAVSAEGVNEGAAALEAGYAGAREVVTGLAAMSTGGGGQASAKPVDQAKPVDPARRKHILDGDRTGGGHRAGTGAGKSEFPSGWSDDKVVQQIESVANDPASSRTVQPNGRTRVEGTREGVKIRVIVDPDGTIRTAHPF